MKSKGDKWSKFKNLNKEIIKILPKSDGITRNEIRRKLDEKKLKVAWVTISSYLDELVKNKKILVKELGAIKPVYFYSRK